MIVVNSLLKLAQLKDIGIKDHIQDVLEPIDEISKLDINDDFSKLVNGTFLILEHDDDISELRDLPYPKETHPTKNLLLNIQTLLLAVADFTHYSGCFVEGNVVIDVEPEFNYYLLFNKNFWIKHRALITEIDQ